MILLAHMREKKNKKKNSPSIPRQCKTIAVIVQRVPHMWSGTEEHWVGICGKCDDNTVKQKKLAH